MRTASLADQANRFRQACRKDTEDLELISRELGVTAATLSGWRDDFLAGGQAALKSRPADDRDEEIARLRSKVGQLTMDNELLGQRCQQMESGRPFASRRRGT